MTPTAPATERQRNDNTVGVVMYLLAALLFALNGVLAKNAILAGLDPMHLTQLRNGGAMVVLVGYLAVRNRSAFRVQRSEVWFLIAYGVVAFTLVQYLYFVTISRLTVGIGTLFAFLAPVFVALWLKFRHRKAVSNRIWLAIALTLVGLILVAHLWQGTTALDPEGVLAGLLCAAALAGYWLLGESGQRHRDPVSLTMWGFVFASLAWAVISPWWSFPFDVLEVDTAPFVDGLPGLPVWTIMVWGILMGTIVPFLLVLGSLRRIGAQRAGIVGTTEPLWAALIGFVLLGEVISGVQILGGLIVLAGVVVAETSRSSGVAVTPGEFPQILE